MTEIPLFKVFMSKHASTAVAEVLQSGYIGQGNKVEEFEKELKHTFSNDYVLTVNAGTSAEHLALHLLKNHKTDTFPGLQDGDEVLTTALTCTATNWPILANNLRIKWVDVDENTLNISIEDLKRKLSPSTKVIFVVHWGGYPVYLDELKQVQDLCYTMYGFKPIIIEDCAHAFGSYYKGLPIGAHGNINTFSFQAIKHLTTIDGGALVVPDNNLYHRGKLLRWYGIDREGNRKDFRCEADVVEWGFKFHMNDVCATVGLANLKEVDNVLAVHKSNGKYYDIALQGIPGLTVLERRVGADSAYWIYSILVDRKDDFMKAMKAKGIVASQVHERNDKHTCVKQYRCALPTLDKVIPRLVNIPVGWWVTESDRKYIVDCIKEGW